MVYDLGIIKRQRYVEPTFIGTGGTVTTATSNSTLYVYHTFTANSVFVPVYNVTAECLIVAGGGAGSDIAGGGAGGFRSLTINFQKISQKINIYTFITIFSPVSFIDT